jgi:hypothetical protein
MLPHYAALNEADNYGYHHNGLVIAQLIRAGQWSQIRFDLGRNVIPLITGVLYAPFGGDIYGALFFSAVLGFCGCVFFCRAFVLSGSGRNVDRYCRLVLFLPSTVMWMSYFGKDCWIALGLGAAAYGFALMTYRCFHSGTFYLLFGLGIVVVIRPHIALMCGAAMIVAYVWATISSRRVSILSKVGQAVVLLGLIAALALTARSFLKLPEWTAQGADEFGSEVASHNRQGGSAREGGSIGGAGAVGMVPRGILRVLFEPFPWDAHNSNAAMAAAENVFLAYLLIRYSRRVWASRAGLSRQPYWTMSVLLSCELLVVFSILPNVGLVSRERAQLTPFLFATLLPVFSRLQTSGRRRGYHRLAGNPMTVLARPSAPRWPAYQPRLGTNRESA